MKKKTQMPVGIVEQVKHLKKQLGDSFKGFEFKKTFSVTSFKGADIDDSQLAKINTFALVELKKEDVFARKMLLAHNAIDRDNERFPDELLEDYAKTLPGKSALFGHKRPDPGEGLYFDAYTETMSPEAFEELTGEKALLPEGLTGAKVLWAWFYMMNIDDNQKTIANIDGGIYRHVSIGFRATDLVSVKKDQNGPVLYWEYVGPGEALEGSLVWLGAQNGATMQKTVLVDETAKMITDGKHAESDDSITDKSHNHEKEDIGKMKEFLLKLSALCGKSLSEDNALDSVKAVIEGKDTEIGTLKTEKEDLEKKNADLQSLANDGKAFRDELIETYVVSKAKLGEVEETDEAQKGLKSVAETYPIAFLKNEVTLVEKRVAEKFPDSELESGDDNENRDSKKSKKNPLVPENEAVKN